MTCIVLPDRRFLRGGMVLSDFGYKRDPGAMPHRVRQGPRGVKPDFSSAELLSGVGLG